ncbi:hypothetical protein ABNC55_16700 [Paenibacillus larvae]|nr:hypothetical protein [Paenibacillus larvae]AQR79062.1 hypothetical protein BXP28_19305 [Paenibacillus larvae subsp. larvae]MDT2192093.1 hypothetical protein [Paenibacillus larvae]MDT2235357.1 hypothetical protein [Paenibacillus larvae]MDT2239386.1 hypothetical protein [Paenibacillus larvae]MDT2246028.1 hypothetical protein [Paenibacillus larvae]
MQEFEELVNIGTLGVLIAEKKWTELAWTLIKKGVKRNPWVLAGWLAWQQQNVLVIKTIKTKDD